MKRYDLSRLMRKAWALYRKTVTCFSEALKSAWAWLKVQAANTAKIEAVADALGVVEEFNTWAGWQTLGRMVIHTEQAAFQVEVDDPTTKKGTRVQSFFLYSQTQPTPLQAA